MKAFFLLFAILFFSLNSYSQSNQLYMKLGTQIPFQHNIGSEFVAGGRVGVQFQYGLITEPYRGFVKHYVAFYESDPRLLSIVQNSFQSGAILGAGFNYHFGKNYFGVFGQYISLQSTSNATEALNAYYGFDCSIIETLMGRVNLFLQSNLYNGGILYGRRFLIKDPALQLHLELGVSKNLTSRNQIQSDRPDIDNINYVNTIYGRLDHSLRDSFLAYLIIPTFNIYFVYNLAGK